MHRKFQFVLVALTILALVLSACGASATTVAPTVAVEPTAAPAEPTDTAAPVEPTATTAVEPTEAPVSMVELPVVDPAAVSGNVVSAGSSTVYPLAEAIATRFESEGYADKVTIDSVGSGAGFERFCVTGETDVANASRGIKDSEKESCAAIGRTPIEFRVGTDAIAMVVSAENDFLTDVTSAELALIFSSSVTKWSEVRAEWPNEDILRFSPGTDSGTFDFFVEGIMAPAHPNAEGKADMEAGEKDILEAANIQFSEDDNVLVQGVQGSPYAIGFFGFAYYVENEGALKALSIDGIAPSAETAEDNSYPLSRPLFIYSDAGIMQAKPQVADYINYFLTYVNEVIIEVGYFPASTEALDAAKQAWLDAMSATVAAAPTEAPTEAPMAEGVTLPAVDPAAVSGNVVSAGSSTVYPLAEAIATRFESEGYADKVTIDSIGSGAGFERFCVTGETDVANASRGIKDSEKESCAAIGRTPIEFRVGTDAIAMVVSAENDFLTDVTSAELALIFSSSVTKWSEVRAEWPNEDILRFSPGTDSGTFDFFVEGIMAPAHPNAEGKADMEAGEKDILEAANIQFSEDDNVLVQGVQGSPYAIGFFGFAYYVENEGALKALSIDGIAPSAETAEDNSYPLSRPLFIYSDAGIMQAKPQVADYINYFLTYVNEVIIEVGYFPASTEALDAAKQAWLDAMK
ncbi:MAG: phosphate ABC transporter substrate-binding protein PstS family protein [Chloroflexota bacterium]